MTSSIRLFWSPSPQNMKFTPVVSDPWGDSPREHPAAANSAAVPPNRVRRVNTCDE